MVDAAAALADHGLAPQRQFLGVMDECFRPLRGAPGLLNHALALTNPNRQRGMAHFIITRSLDNLAAPPSDDDRLAAHWFLERAGIKILAALPRRELDRINQFVRLSAPERALVSSWATSETLPPRSVHPGRGRFLIKTAKHPGLPVALSLVGDEWRLYDTDLAVHREKAGHEGAGHPTAPAVPQFRDPAARP